MRFIKAKLAALAISVFVAVPGFTAYAETIAPDATHVGDVEEEKPVEQKEENTENSSKIDHVVFHEDLSVDFVYENGKTIEKAGTATKVLPAERPQSCADSELAYLQIYVEGLGTVISKEPLETAPALKHPEAYREYKEILVKDDPADHTNSDYHVTGKIQKGIWCNLCNTWVSMTETDHEVVHNWEFNRYIIPEDQEDWVTLVNGEPTLVDPTHGGVYDIEYICTVGKETDTYHNRTNEYMVLEPTVGEALVPVFYYDEKVNIKGYYDGTTLYEIAEPGSNTLFAGLDTYNYDDNKIVLIDCAKPGYYTVVYSAQWTTADKNTGAFTEEEFYYDENGKYVENLTDAVLHTVPKHHVASGRVRVARDDKDPTKKLVGINVFYKFFDRNGKETDNEDEAYEIVFYNNNCLYDDTAMKDYECLGGPVGETSWVHGELETIPADPNAHRIPIGYTQSLAAIESAKKETDPAKYNELIQSITGYGKKHDGRYDAEKGFIGLENVTEYCEHEADTNTGDMIWYCTVCGTPLETFQVKLPVIKAKWAQKRENIVPAKCYEDGSYEAVEYCLNCGYERSRTLVIIPASEDHNFGEPQIVWRGDVVVDYNSMINVEYEGWFYNDFYDDEFDWVGVECVGTPAEYTSSYAEDYFVYGMVYATCQNEGCTERIPLGSADLEVVALTRNNRTSKVAGSITLAATYTDEEGNEYDLGEESFRYYSSVNEYQVGVEPEEPKPVDPAPVDPDKLPAVTNLKAAAIGMNRVQVSWDAVDDADGYLVLKDGTQIAYTMGATTYVDRNANSEDFNYYWVIPFQKVNGKNYKGELSNYVWAIGRVVGQVQKLTAIGVEDGVELSWSAATGANGYVILSKTGSNTAPFNAPVEVSGTTATVKAEAGKVQFYWVYATYTNADGNRVAAGKVSPFAWAIAE